MSEDKTIKVSLGLMMAGIVLVIGLSIAGGFLSSLWTLTSTNTFENTDGERVITTIQEVTISPNQSALERVAAARRSILTLDNGQAVVLTSDGLIVTTNQVSDSDFVGIDSEGREVVLDLVGRDDYYGLTFLRSENSVLVPLDLASEHLQTGEELLVLGRALKTSSDKVYFRGVIEYVLPTIGNALGIQQLARIEETTDLDLDGAAAINEEADLAGILIEDGLILPSRFVRDSFERVTSGKRESNPWIEVGIVPAWDFVEIDGNSYFGARLEQVQPSSRAAQGKLLRGDVIIEIGGEELDWRQPVLGNDLKDENVSVKVVRGEQIVELNI